MNKEYINLLICPKCSSPFEMRSSSGEQGETRHLECVENKHSFPVRNGIPRFVNTGNYAESFGFQWRKFSKVQLDSYNGTDFSEERFRLITGWTSNDLADKLVLDAGCGAGRFAEIAIKDNGRLVAFDLSEAVDATQENLLPSNPLLFQASIYELPLPPGVFDFVYCIGVVQHTPDPMATIRNLCRLVKPGGHIGLWIYERDWKSYIGTLGFKYALRPVFTRLSRSRQFWICKGMVNLFFPIVSFCKSLGPVGKIIMRMLPIASAHLQYVPLSKKDLKTWVLLDTFDMYSPAYDQPQSFSSVARLLVECGFDNIRRHPHGGISITARRQAKG